MTAADDLNTLLDLGAAEVAGLANVQAMLAGMTLTQIVELSGRIGVSRAAVDKLPDMPAKVRMDYQLRVVFGSIEAELRDRISDNAKQGAHQS